MNSANPILQQLKDIETPTQIGTWPLAWGWWFIIILSAVVIIWLSWLLISNWRFKQALREAKRLLNEVDIDEATARQINVLLKRVALHYGNRRQVAALTNEAWLQWLNKQQTKVTFEIEELTFLYSNKNASTEQLAEYKSKALTWLNSINVRQLNTKGDQHV